MFITFEGLDGSGKTTVLELFTEYLLKKYSHIETLFTREPGGKGIKEAEQIREIILHKDSDLSAKTEALLYTSSRRIHLEKVIIPALKDNKLVICDRYIDSFYAYQGFGRDLGLEFVETITELILEKTYPDITVFLEISPEQAKERRNAGRLIQNRLDDEADEFHKKVYKGYHHLINRNPERFLIIDATKPLKDVFDELISKIEANEAFKDYITKYAKR
ncbi:dTMP kinase [Mycoplasma sp. Ms02]|uniref:dTMP kinase n=1 Tax=Mycoplasma sp. Ms02 TaxID=353851 RepID=UPI001C8A5B07|nr:dTMP kinase [Mycoplasma sp. Ms02]QZE12617.1 dTMP kinase [Mycoplasma sp. Ms02]